MLGTTSAHEFKWLVGRVAAMIEHSILTFLVERWEDEYKRERRTPGKASEATQISDKLVWMWDVMKQACCFEYERIHDIANITQNVAGSQTHVVDNMKDF